MISFSNDGTSLYTSLAGVATRASKFFLIVDGNDCYSLSGFEEHLEKCGCPTSGQKIFVDNVIITNPDAAWHTVNEVLQSSKIDGELLYQKDIEEQGTNSTKPMKLLKEVLCRPFKTPSGGTDEVDSEQATELESSLIISIGGNDDKEGKCNCNVVLTGFATNKEIEKCLNPSLKEIDVFQVPRNGSKDCLQWFRSDQKSLLNRCSEYYSNFKANVYLISPGENPIDNPSSEVLSGIINANATRDPMHKCVIVVANSRGLCRQKLRPLEDRHKVAKEKCLELMENIGKFEHELPEVQRNLESHIAFIAVTDNIEAINQFQTHAQQTLKELTSTRTDYLKAKKEFEENSNIVEHLQSWQEVVTIYHTDDLFAPSATTVITTDQGQDLENPQECLDMSTLVEWSPDGYLSKLKQHIDKQLQRKVLTFSTDGKDITNTLFKMNAIHLVQTYSVDTPWNTDNWKPTQEVWVVKETLSDEQLQHALYIELVLDHSNPTERYYQVYHYETRSQACLWMRVYKTVPNSNEAYKIQLKAIE